MERQPQQQQHPSLARRPKLGLAAILPPGAVAPKRPRAGGCGACDDWTIAVPTRNEAASGNRRREGAFAKATIGGTEPMEMTCQAIKDGPQLGASRCPCCDRTLGVAGRQVVGETDVKSRCVDSLLTCSSSDSDDTGDDTEESSRTVPGYVVKEVIAQGHVHKKGSGCDWLGSRAWKDRWAVLVRAKTDNSDVEVPLLQIFWSPSSPTPSTVISLESAVVLPDYKTDPSGRPTTCHPFRFKICHVKKSVHPDASPRLDRVFGCPKEGCEAWVLSISQALLKYEKDKANLRRLNHLPLCPPRRIMAPATRDMSPKSLQRRTRLPSTRVCTMRSRILTEDLLSTIPVQRLATMEDSGRPAEGPPGKNGTVTDVLLGKRKQPPPGDISDAIRSDMMDPPRHDGGKIQIPALAGPGPQAGDLMSRLHAFLPRLQAANEALPDGGVEGDKQIDLDLQSDDDDDDDDDQGHVDTSQHLSALIQEVHVDGQGIQNKLAGNDLNGGIRDLASAPSSKSDDDAGGQTIEIQFSLGDLAGNPLMRLLEDDNDDDDDDDDDDKNGYDMDIPARSVAVASLLMPDGSTGQSDVPVRGHEYGRGRPLITEL